MNKQETLEEFIQKSYPKTDSHYDFTVTSKIRNGIRLGAKWQQEQDNNKYSEEEVYNILEQAMKDAPIEGLTHHYNGDFRDLKDWFENLKR